MRNTEQQTWMQDRVSNAEKSYAKGAMSLRDLTDIRWSLRQLEIDAEVMERRHQRAKDLAAEHEQRLAVAQAEIHAAETRLHGLHQQQTHIAQRMSTLTLRAPFPAQLVWNREWHVGDQIAAGTPLATAHGVGARQLSVEVTEDVFVHVKLGARVRFTTAVVSVYKYDYYWGEVSERRVVTDATGMYHYELTSTLTPSDHALPLSQLPLGSSGRVDIAIGRKRLLAQLVGW
jgi:multidrug resistance efflux pump